MAAPAIERRDSVVPRLLGVFLWGAAVSVALGVYAGSHRPTGEKPYTLFFSDTLQLKVWFATAAFVLACLQVLLAMRLYGRLRWPAKAPSWLGDAHRLSGTVAFVLSLPVAYHCLWSLGYQSTTTRVVVHSIVGCVFYGAFVAKVLSVRMEGLPGWTLPVVGGLVFASLVTIFLTSSVWYFTDRPAGLPLF